MSLSSTGKQEPRIYVPTLDEWKKYPASDGADAAELSRQYGIDPFPWQELVLNYWLTRNEHDKFAFSTCGLPIPRQNGKNAVLEMRELYGLCIIGEKILHTAHRVDTARKAFLRLITFFENPNYPELTEIVTSIRKANGQEAIFLTNGGSIEFSSRVNGGSRGSTYDVVVFDEAQELTDDQMEAIMSTLAAAPLNNRQMIFTGTPPSPVSPGTIFQRRRKNILEGKTENACWLEWSVSEIGDIHDVDRWYDTNPTLGHLITEQFVSEECETLSPDGFARERLGWWENKAFAKAVFTKDQWEACKFDPPAPSDDEIISIGIKFTPDGSKVAISAATKAPGRLPFVELLFYEPMNRGTTWIADWLVERKRTIAEVAIDGKSNVDALVGKLEEKKFPKKAIKVMGTDDVVAAASMLSDAITEVAVTHAGQPLLADSMTKTQKRIIGNKDKGGWSFGNGEADAAPAESIASAYRSVMTTKRNPRRKQRCS